jgi:hypothetical protein
MIAVLLAPSFLDRAVLHFIHHALGTQDLSTWLSDAEFPLVLTETARILPRGLLSASDVNLIGADRAKAQGSRATRLVITSAFPKNSAIGPRLRTWHAAFEGGRSGHHRNKEAKRPEGGCVH